jgi:glycosyltransferase involved in cell wall biosynthesis
LLDIDLAAQPSEGAMDKLQQLLRRRAERQLLRRYGTLIALTYPLKDAMRATVPRTPIHVVPLGLDVSLYPFAPTVQRPASPTICVVGSMNWFPSFSAAERLLTRLLPSIRATIPDIQVLIVGWNAEQALRAYLPQVGVQVFENVPQTRTFFERSSLLLYAPKCGSGMKVKVLEAFAYGVPVVTTPDGIEGIPARDGVHVECCDDDAGLIDRTLQLLKSLALQEKQRTAARHLVEQLCNPTRVIDCIEECYADILVRRRRRAA